MRYFVTGGTGFLGSHVANRLREASHEVVALVRDPVHAAGLEEIGCELAQGDITDKNSMRGAMRGVDGVFHLAAWYKVGTREPAAERINVDGTRHVLELMRELDVPKGVYTSTLAVFGDTKGKLPDESYRAPGGSWLSEYDRTKWKAHYEVALPMMEEGLPLVVAQPGVVYGPGDTSGVRNLWLDYLHRRLPAVPKRTAWCWGHIHDTTEALLLAMARGKVRESYILAGPPHTLEEAFAIAESITGIPAPRTRAAPWMLKAASGVMGAVERFAKMPSSYSSETLRVTAGVTYLGSSEKARRELRWEPRTLQQGLGETLRHEMRLLGMRAPPAAAGEERIR